MRKAKMKLSNVVKMREHLVQIMMSYAYHAYQWDMEKEDDLESFTDSLDREIAQFIEIDNGE